MARRLLRASRRSYLILSISFIMLFMYTSQWRGSAWVKVTRDARVVDCASGADTLTLALTVRMSDTDGSVVLALVDSSYVDMAVNFFVTSILRHNIDNFMFLSMDEEGCRALTRELPEASVPCFPVVGDVAGDLLAKYGTQEFARKLNVRTRVMLHALRMGVAVLNTDVDMVYLRNPLPELARLCGKGSGCDLATMMATEGNRHNAGFMYFRPTNASMTLLEAADALYSDLSIVDQTAMNKILKRPGKFIASGRGADFTVNETRLPLDRYLVGNRYFVRGVRTFAGDAPCPQCTVVHNNQIHSKAAKIYRFKEMALWDFDGGRYYSDPKRQYIAYANPLEPDPRGRYDVTRLEKQALANALALGAILNRTVIMPRFHCDSPSGFHPCSLVHVIGEAGLESLDSDPEISYRESVFLQHPLVPSHVTSSKKKLHVIQNSVRDSSARSTQIMTPGYPSRGPSKAEIVSWFGDYIYPVLRFESLYGEFQKIWSADIQQLTN